MWEGDQYVSAGPALFVAGHCRTLRAAAGEELREGLEGFKEVGCRCCVASVSFEAERGTTRVEPTAYATSIRWEFLEMARRRPARSSRVPLDLSECFARVFEGADLFGFDCGG